MDKFISKTVQSAFSGTTDVELVPAPPAGQAFVIESIIAKNLAGATRIYSIFFDKNGTQTRLMFLSVNNNIVFAYPFNLSSLTGPRGKFAVLSASDETIVVKSNATDTSPVVATFSIIEAEIV